jgi:hypothetical protein
MKKVTLLCGLLLAISATVASAGAGVNLRWTDCFIDGGVQNKTFTCTTNNGSSTLVGSIELGAALPQASGIEAVVDVGTAGATLPAWWGFKNAGSCRTTSLTVNAALPGTAVLCSDWVAGGGSGGLAAYSVGLSGPNTSRMVIGFATGTPLPDLFPAIEYFAFNAKIDNAKTVGTGSCAGCSTAACIILNSIKVATPPVAGQPSRDVVLTGATNLTDSNFAFWQGGAGVIVGTHQGCPGAVPTHNSTWSSVKSLYR